ncbi:MAG: thiolase family protein [Planctomycetes bacterium]|nr:thiolase family protein [Planctomycetota bacterium]
MAKDPVVIVSGARTAVGSFGGSLKDVSAGDLGGVVVQAAIHRAGLRPEQVDEVVMGCVGQAAENAFVARLASVAAGVPYRATALTVNRLCASGLQAIVTAAQEIDAGMCRVAVAGGTENMSQIPFYLRNARFGYRMGHGILEDGLVTALTDPFSRGHMGLTAENIAERYGISRKEQDDLALTSQRRAAAAQGAGKFREEIVPVEVRRGTKETAQFDRDEYLRPDASPASLAKLRPAFKENGTVTAGNASGVNDGAAAVCLMPAAAAREMGVRPLARIVDAAVAGVDPAFMGMGPVPALRQLYEKTGVKQADIGLFEVNEAFAVQAIACLRELDLDPEKVNVNGSGIAIGHPIGATGCIITIKLINEMRRRSVRYGAAALCIGGGQGLAVLFERCD